MDKSCRLRRACVRCSAEERHNRAPRERHAALVLLVRLLPFRRWDITLDKTARDCFETSRRQGDSGGGGQTSPVQIEDYRACWRIAGVLDDLCDDGSGTYPAPFTLLAGNRGWWLVEVGEADRVVETTTPQSQGHCLSGSALLLIGTGERCARLPSSALCDPVGASPEPPDRDAPGTRPPLDEDEDEAV